MILSDRSINEAIASGRLRIDPFDPKLVQRVKGNIQDFANAARRSVEAGCDFLTLGQYLRPTPEHLPVVRYLPPAEFDELGVAARSLGFRRVASGPFVRSSYHAREMSEVV